MRIVLQLVESYLKQEIPSILITTDNNKYLFNVPSSFQRFTRQNKIKFPVGAHFFFTKSCTQTITGLTGLLLTMFERGDTCNTKLYLDDKLFKYIQELRYKMGFKIVPISYNSWSGKQRIGINNFQKVISLMKREDNAAIFNNMDKYIEQSIPINEQNNSSKYYNLVDHQFKNEDLSITPFHIKSNDQQITNFIISPNPLPGKILNNKLKQYGIKGAVVSQLVKNGKITINGKEIKIEEVKQPDSQSPNIIILHYNSVSSITEILNNEIFKKYISSKQNFTYCVVHIVQNAEIITSNEFKLMLSIFSDITEHLVYNRKYRNSTDSMKQLLCLSAQVQLVSNLSQYFPLCMPNLQQQQLNYLKSIADKTETIDTLFPQKKVRAYKKCHQLVIAPKKSWGYRAILASEKKTQQPIQEQFTKVNLDLELQQQMVQKTKIIDPKVVFLGTGSMKPSKYRNVSSILVQFGSHHSIMLDCGQGSHIQIAQHYGYQNYQQNLLKLRTIFITHIHSDHNLGILDLISERNAIIRKRNLNRQDHSLFLILPANVVPWFQSFCQNIENLKEYCDVVFIQSLRSESINFQGTMSKENAFTKKCSTSSEMVDEEDQEQSEDDQLSFNKPEWSDILKEYSMDQSRVLQTFEKYLKEINIVEFMPCPVIHCPQSYGIVMKHTSEIKISYSGDTRPCREFAVAAVDSTIMIHQATFGDDLQGNAESHYHSTVGQAIDIGMKSRSWKTALTHFSQRYKSAADIVDPRMYKLNKEKQQYAQHHTIVCYDHFEMNVSKAHLMPHYSRALARAIPKDGKQ